jgi:hypothetical protein
MSASAALSSKYISTPQIYITNSFIFCHAPESFSESRKSMRTKKRRRWTIKKTDEPAWAGAGMVLILFLCARVVSARGGGERNNQLLKISMNIYTCTHHITCIYTHHTHNQPHSQTAFKSEGKRKKKLRTLNVQQNEINPSKSDDKFLKEERMKRKNKDKTQSKTTFFL